MDEQRASQPGRAVEYPSAFQISRPFGVEQICAVAFTEAPQPVPTEKRLINGEEYEVVAELNLLVKHRGLKRKTPAAQVAESKVSLTTTPR